MKLLTLSLITLLSSPLVSAVGNAIVKNHCKETVYLWSVGGSIGPEQTLHHGQSYSEKLHYDPQSGGIAIKITTTENGLFNASPQMDYAYTLDGNDIYYDLSDVFGDPFAGHPVSVVSSDENCPGICWPNGVRPAGSQVQFCGSACDITLNLCAKSC